MPITTPDGSDKMDQRLETLATDLIRDINDLEAGSDQAVDLTSTEGENPEKVALIAESTSNALVSIMIENGETDMDLLEGYQEFVKSSIVAKNVVQRHMDELYKAAMEGRRDEVVDALKELHQYLETKFRREVEEPAFKGDSPAELAARGAKITATRVSTGARTGEIVESVNPPRRKGRGYSDADIKFHAARDAGLQQPSFGKDGFVWESGAKEGIRQVYRSPKKRQEGEDENTGRRRTG